MTMTTRADFYVGRGPAAEWLGSIACDGYPASTEFPSGVSRKILQAKTEATYRKHVSRLLESRDDATLPGMGWPWPWTTSHTTDYAYAFDPATKTVYNSCFGGPWHERDHDPEDALTHDPGTVFPDMTGRKNLARGPRSGTIMIS